MWYEVSIPNWTDGRPLCVEHVEAGSADRAGALVLARFAPACPPELARVGPCDCDRCNAAGLAAFMARRPGEP
jgi:hypothetical protein